MKLDGPADCNNNGIDDARDVVQGTLDDINHNGIGDPCDPDTAIAGLVEHGWVRYAMRSDTSYFGVLYKHMAHLIVVNYTVPLGIGRHSIRIVATGQNADTVTILERTRQRNGAYTVEWEPALAGRVLDRGRCDIILFVDSTSRRRAVAWDWTRQFR